MVEAELVETGTATPIKGPQTYKLQTPVEFGSQTITEITIKPLKGRHVKHLKRDSSLAELISVASKASGVSMGVFDEMSSSDVMAIAELVGNSI